MTVEMRRAKKIPVSVLVLVVQQRQQLALSSDSSCPISTSALNGWSTVETPSSVRLMLLCWAMLREAVGLTCTTRIFLLLTAAHLSTLQARRQNKQNKHRARLAETLTVRQTLTVMSRAPTESRLLTGLTATKVPRVRTMQSVSLTML